MTLPSERIKQIDLGQALATAYAMRNARRQGEMNDWQFSRAQEDYERQQAFRSALAAGDLDAARAADPTAFMGVMKSQTEARRAGLDIQKDESKLFDDRQARNQNAQRAVFADLETDQTPEGLNRARKTRDALVATKKVDHFNLPGEESAVDNWDYSKMSGGTVPTDDGVMTHVQAEPTKSEIVTAQAGAGVDVAGKQRAINEQTTALRDKFGAEPETKAWKVVKQNIDNLLSAAQDGPGDLVRIYSLVKTLDTITGVKDAETGMVGASGGYIEQMKSLIARAKGTGILSDDLRVQMEETAHRLGAAYEANYNAQASNYVKLAKDYKLDPGQVVLPMAPQAEKAVASAPPDTKGPRDLATLPTWKAPPQQGATGRREPPPEEATIDPFLDEYDAMKRGRP